MLLVSLVDRLPTPPPGPRFGRPPVYSERLFLKALVVMVLKQAPTVHAFLALLDQPTPEMQRLRQLLTEDGRFPSRRTWERRLTAIPTRLPDQIACLGEDLVARFVLGDSHDQDPALHGQAAAGGWTLVANRCGPYPHHDPGGEVRRILHKERSVAIENFNGQFKAIFDARGPVTTRGSPRRASSWVRSWSTN